MAKFSQLVGNFLIVALLILGLFSFMIIVQTENDAPQPLTDNKVFNQSFAGLISTLDNGTGEAEEKYDVFNTEEPKPGVGSIVLFSIVSVGKTFSTIIIGTFTALIRLPLIIFGIPQQVYNIILTWLIIGVIIALWLLYKLGG